MSRTLISTYTGAGGLDIGFRAAGFAPIWANDIDAAAAQTYEAEFDSHIHVGNIRTVPWPEPLSADVMIGGPPCQGFSLAGRMDPNDPRSRHVYDFMEMVGHVRPIAFVMENVAALAVNPRWADVRDWLVARGRQLGYDARIHLVKASDYGVPQARERMFLVGLPEGVAADFQLTPSTELSPPTVIDALSSLPQFGKPGNDSAATAKITFAKRPVLRKSPFAGMLFNGQGRPLNLEAPSLTLPASMGGNGTPIIDQYQLDHGGDHWILEYHDHLMGGGESYEGEAPSRLRRVTVEEAAAIQTFPPDMTFVGSQSAQFRQIGNAVPPRLARSVAEALMVAIERPGMSAASLQRNRETLFAVDAYAS